MTITFDHSRQYTVAFLNMFKRLRDAKNTTLEMKGKLPLRLGYDALKRFDADRSRQNSFLQLSDLLATSFMDCLIKAHKGVSISLDEAMSVVLIDGPSGKIRGDLFRFLGLDEFPETNC